MRRFRRETCEIIYTLSVAELLYIRQLHPTLLGMNIYTRETVGEREAIALILWNLLGAVSELKAVCSEVLDSKDARLVAAEECICAAMAGFESAAAMEELRARVFDQKR